MIAPFGVGQAITVVVDAVVAKAVAAGGRTYKEPQDHGFMYGHGFEDLDRHIWEVFHMSASPPNRD